MYEQVRERSRGRRPIFASRSKCGASRQLGAAQGPKATLGAAACVTMSVVPSALSPKPRSSRVHNDGRWLVVEQLPGYSHDLNPMELVWGNVKARELANLCPDTIDEADVAVNTVSGESATTNRCALTSSNTPVLHYDRCVTVFAKDV